MPAGELVPEEVKVLSHVHFVLQFNENEKKQQISAHSRRAMQTKNPHWMKAGQSFIMQDGCASCHFCGVTRFSREVWQMCVGLST